MVCSKGTLSRSLKRESSVGSVRLPSFTEFFLFFFLLSISFFLLRVNGYAVLDATGSLHLGVFPSFFFVLFLFFFFLLSLLLLLLLMSLSLEKDAASSRR